MRLVFVVLAGFVVLGCSDPEETTDPSGTQGTEGAESSSTGDTSPPLTSTTTSDSGTTQDVGEDESTSEPPTTGDTQSLDQPPEVTLFVNGSADPRSATNAQRAIVSATATDDGAIDRVEFYDGETLLATVSAEPYETEILLTSLDNGSHPLQARAFDDAAQEGVSDVIDYAVEITGGATVADDTNVFQTGGFPTYPGGGAVVDGSDIVVIAPVTTTGFGITGIAAVSYAAELDDVNWQLTEPVSLVDGQPQYLPMGKPYLREDGSELIIGGNDMGTDGILDPNVSIFRLDAAGTGTLPFVSIPSNPMVQNLPVAGVARDDDGNVFVHGPDDNIRRYAPNDGVLLWESPAGTAFTTSEFGMVRMLANEEGDLFTDTVSCGASSCTLSTAKINGFDGVLQWSEDLTTPENGFFWALGASTPLPDGGVLTAFCPAAIDGGGVSLTFRDDAGAVMVEYALAGPERFAINDIAVDAQGQVVLVGARDAGGDAQAWVARVSPDGALLWDRTIEYGVDSDYSLALAMTEQGQLVVVGVSDTTAGLVFTADLWVALLDL